MTRTRVTDTIGRRSGRGRCRILVGTTLAFLLAAGSQPAVADNATITLEELRARVERIQGPTAEPPRGGLPAPPASPDPSAPASRLRSLAASLAADAAGVPAGARQSRGYGFLASAAEEVAGAVAAYGKSPDLGTVFEHLLRAGQALHAADASLPATDRPKVDARSRKLVEAARGIVERIRDLGTSEPPSFERLTGDRFLRLADASITAGRVTVAIAMLGQSGQWFQSSIRFDLDDFERNLIDELEGNTVGFAYSIASNGVSVATGASGPARTGTDTPAEVALVLHSPFKEMYTMSMSKTITAVALLHALDDAGVSVDAPISPYLPSDWSQGPGVWLLTFRSLLTHTSGLADGLTFNQLENVINTGTAGTLAFEDADYTNSNFALMRVLVPQLTIGEDVIDVFSNVLPEAEVYVGLYEDYVVANVLAPAGVDASWCGPDEAITVQTLGYRFDNLALPSYQAGNLSTWCGPTGWHLSAHELTSFLAHLRYTDDLLEDQMRELMDDGFLGWLNPTTFSDYVVGAWGEYRGHGGDSHVAADPGMTGCMMNFPNGTQATVLINSRANGYPDHICTVLRDAYDDAWS